MAPSAVSNNAATGCRIGAAIVDFIVCGAPKVLQLGYCACKAPGRPEVNVLGVVILSTFDEISIMGANNFQSAPTAGNGTADDGAWERRIELLSQRYFLDNIAHWQSANLLPLALIGLCNLGRPSFGLTLAIIAANAACMIGMYAVCRRLRRHDDLPAQYRAWQLYQGLALLSGILWGSLMLPVATTLGKDIASTFVCVIIIATVSVTSMVIATRWKGFVAFGSGFFACLLPQTLWFIDDIGAIPLIATVAFIPALWSLASAVYKQDRSLIRAQLENEDLTTELAHALERAEHLATRDSLTGLYNRRAFEQVAHSLRAASDGDPMSLILIDLDHFKAINDQHGHACGDSVLQKSAAVILETMRPVDVLGRGDSAVARWGGEEFLLLLPDCSLPMAVQVAERLRQRLTELTDPAWPPQLAVSGSFGVTCWRPEAALHHCINEADEAMYRAKRAGRNRVMAGQGSGVEAPAGREGSPAATTA